MNNFQTLRIIYFSPTHTSEHIARAIAEGIGIPRRIETELTFDEDLSPVFIQDELTVIAVPVYGGRVAPTALKRLQRFKADNAPVILAAVYGNRDYEDALLELRDTAKTLGFSPLTAGAFIGEHSYSTPQMPLSAGRPNKPDLECARHFGKESVEKLNRLLSETTDGKLTIPQLFVKGHFPYKIVPPNPNAPCPECNENCFGCGTCLDVCPTHALHLDDTNSRIITDTSRCIRCCACVKACPNAAREFHTPFAAFLYENFNTPKEPELFL